MPILAGAAGACTSPRRCQSRCRSSGAGADPVYLFLDRATRVIQDYRVLDVYPPEYALHGWIELLQQFRQEQL